MEIRKLSPQDPKDPKEIQKIFDDYKKQKSAPVAPTAPPQVELVGAKETLIQITDLPSKFLPYPKGSTIFFKPYTYGDMQVFNSSTLNEEDRIKFILDGIITNGFPKDNLSFQDFLFIAILRKVSAFNTSKFTYNFVCESCGHVNQQTAGLSAIEFKDLEIPSIPVIVDVDDETKLYLKPLTIGASLKLRNVTEDYYLKAYAECVMNMSSREAYLILKAAQGDLIEILEEVDRMLAFGEQTLDVTCEECKSKNKFGLGDIQHLVQPFRRSAVDIKSRISFG